MAKYEVQFATSAAKEFRDLPTDIKRRVREVVDSLRIDAHSPNVCKLKGHEQLYRIRVGSYRLVYELDEKNKRILVTRVRHRREAYR